MRVLHDMDVPHWVTLRALKRGVKLVIFAISKMLGIRIRIVDDIYEEVRENVDVMIKLDKLVGVTSIMGIKREILDTYPNIMEDLKEYDIDVREHIHIGDKKYRPFGWRKYSDPNRKRLWIPPLDQPKETWNYDSDYILGKRKLLKSGQLPLWHVDGMGYLKHYIIFLYWILVEGGEIYEKREDDTEEN